MLQLVEKLKDKSQYTTVFSKSFFNFIIHHDGLGIKE